MTSVQMTAYELRNHLLAFAEQENLSCPEFALGSPLGSQSIHVRVRNASPEQIARLRFVVDAHTAAHASIFIENVTPEPDPPELDPAALTGNNPPICDLLHCNRRGPHWVGEYGCSASNVWRCIPGEAAFDLLATNCKQVVGRFHFRGCGCAGDPSELPAIPQWSPFENDRRRVLHWLAEQPTKSVDRIAETRRALDEFAEALGEVDAALGSLH